jgi:bifunctional ADP-heptose synthase (sugar kinase/adenylyltransferase)
MALESLVRTIEEWRSRGLRWGVAVGAFDLVHAEHARRLVSIRSSVDRLVALVTEDEWTAEKLGEGHPVSPAADRARVVAGLRMVDAVAIVAPGDVPTLQSALQTAEVWGDVEDAGAARWRRLRGERS